MTEPGSATDSDDTEGPSTVELIGSRYLIKFEGTPSGTDPCGSA